MPQTDPNPAEGARGARFAIEPGRAGMVIVDMQNCFVADSLTRHRHDDPGGINTNVCVETTASA